MLTGFFLAFIGFILLSPLCSTIPKDCDSLGGIARFVVRTQVSLDPEYKIWTRQTITEAVLRLAGEQMGVPAEKISLTESMGKFFG